MSSPHRIIKKCVLHKRKERENKLQESFKPVYKNHLLSKILRLNLKRSNVAYNSNNAKMRNGTMYIF
ncbi:unnamed protein product [Brassica oleracea]|uniref:Uncharacterized protein n=2 Tax=Brassica TaxID=3705 RepID=A0A3P6HAL0_BRAOL|nr:unnamed protein product [Brassica napus]VDD62979.1 unnamed protein product [Brassica oleracea]